MPIGPTRTKKQKANVVHTEMSKFAKGELHSGSKTGKIVTNPKQAVAIALSESGQSNKMHAGQPHPPTNPGCYDNEAHKGLVEGGYSRKGEAFRPGADQAAEDAAARAQDYEHMGSGMQPTLQMQHESLRRVHTFGHSVGDRSGALRLSGHPGAHRIGAKRK